MTTKFLSFDAFGTYEAGGPIDQIIDAFDVAKVIYQHHHLTKGHFEMAYLGTPRAERIIKTVAERHYARRAWAYRTEARELLERRYSGDAFEQIATTLNQAFYGLYSHFDLPVQDCVQCGEACPTVLVVEDRCPNCKEFM